jgi:anaerobic ribonucleoside-triphosphate reductase activating protein
MSITVFNPVYSVVLQEVPGEISVAWMVATCKQGCRGCSYKYLEKFGKIELDMQKFEKILKDNQGLATCVLFMGGEEESSLPDFLDRAKSMGYKTCMYTGMKAIADVDIRILSKLDYIKVGRWEGKSLKDKDTNQRFYELPGEKDITGRFQQKNASDIVE